MSTENTDKIVLTGGHAATTAIPVIEELKKIYPQYKLYWATSKSAIEGKKVPTSGETVMPKYGVEVITITAGRLQRKFTVWTIPSLIKIPVGMIQSLILLLRLRPKVVVSFGGFASVPVCVSAWILNIPVIIHEQTVVVGLANKINSYFAKKVLIAREESRKYFPSGKTILIGNPVSQKILNIKGKNKLPDTPTVYITGGSSGSQKINDAVFEVLETLTSKYKIIHQTGRIDFVKFKGKEKTNYKVYDFIDPNDIPDIFEKADIIISRAGANTLSEIMVIKRPSIIVPISWSSHNEQVKNAQMVADTGLALILEEKNLNGKNLMEKLETVRKNWKQMSGSSSEISNMDRIAHFKFVQEVGEFLR